MSRSFFGILALVLVVIPSLGQAQDRKSPLVGYLSASTRSSHAGSFEALRKGLRELGYIEAQNIVVEARFAEGNTEKLAELVSELLRLNPDIILAGGSQALRPVWEATKTVPIVVAHIEDPLREGFVRSLSRPGGNVTGLSRMAGDLEGKRLELLKETLPGLRRVSMFFNPSNPTNVPIVKEVENAAKALGLTLQRLDVDDSADVNKTLMTIRKAHSQAILIITDRLIGNHRKRILEFCERKPNSCNAPYEHEY